MPNDFIAVLVWVSLAVLAFVWLMLPDEGDD